MAVSLQVLKKKSSEAYLGSCQMSMMKFFLKKELVSFNRLLFFAKKNIFFTIFTAVILNYLKQTDQIFKTAILLNVSEDLILSYDLIF